MNISDETVGSHMKEILSRLGANSRTKAVLCYLQMIDQADALGMAVRRRSREGCGTEFSIFISPIEGRVQSSYYSENT